MSEFVLLSGVVSLFADMSYEGAMNITGPFWLSSDEGRGELVDQIRSYQPWRAKPARRVYIPKAGGKIRPLGIPTLNYRVMQTIVKNALES